jgi:hypothetical protein
MSLAITANIAQFIFNNNVGCRYGTTTQGAAYGFMDIVGGGEDGGPILVPPATIIRWLSTPDAAEFEPRWDERLWNTCGIIVGLSSAGTILLVSEAAPTAERYRLHGEIARGDKYSFRKCNLLPPNAAILATITYGTGQCAAPREALGPPPSTTDPDPAEVEAVYDEIMAALKKLA